MSARDSTRISPTAHYTAYVWFQNGLSEPALATPLGRVLHAALWLPNALVRAAGLRDLDENLLARHRLIDALLEGAIAEGRVHQVIEVAAGLSPRGVRFARRHPELRYVEADLPQMAARKRRLLDERGLGGARHEVVAVDALADDGPLSLAALAERLDRTLGCALVTEGLINYFDRDTVEQLWRRCARLLGGFAHGLYLSDDLFSDDSDRYLAMRTFGVALSAFARGFHVHHASADECRAALCRAGFADVTIHDPGDRQIVRVIEART